MITDLFVEAMSAHVHRQPAGLDKKIKIDYSNFPGSPPDSNEKKVATALVHILEKAEIIVPVEEAESGLKWFLVSHLISLVVGENEFLVI